MKSQQNEGICGSTEQSEVLLDLLSVMLTLQLPTFTKLYDSVLASILGPPSFVKYSDLMQFKRDKR